MVDEKSPKFPGLRRSIDRRGDAKGRRSEVRGEKENGGKGRIERRSGEGKSTNETKNGRIRGSVEGGRAVRKRTRRR